MMLKKEKKRAQDAAAQLADITNGHSLASRSASRLSTTPSLREGNTDTISADHEGRAIQYMKRGPQLSMGKQEAFEIFIRDHEDHVTIKDNKELLKQRSTEAKGIGKKLNEARSRINELKKQLEVQRRQRAAHGVIGNHPGVEEEVDPVEKNLCKHIKQEKQAYNSAIGRLKELRTEIEHLQLLLERAKVKLQRDFQKWWSQEASSMQAGFEESDTMASAPHRKSLSDGKESEATGRCPTRSPNETLQPSSPTTPGFCTPGLSSTVRDSPADPNPDCSTAPVQELRSFIPKSVPPVTAVPARHDKSLDGRVTDFTPSSEWRALSNTNLSSSSIPLTGDQQTDADILAFIRARQKLLNRADQPQ